jgi:hypothetical protein
MVTGPKSARQLPSATYREHHSTFGTRRFAEAARPAGKKIEASTT